MLSESARFPQLGVAVAATGRLQISVVIPLHNKERFIGRALDSVLSQTWRDYEIVVIDDGSTDKGPDLVAARCDPTIRLIRQPNAGVSAARNRGISEARFPWIAFLDADDEYLPTFLERCAACIGRFPEIGAVYTGILRHRRGSPIIVDASGSAPGVRVDYLRFSSDAPDRGMWSSCVVVRKEVFSLAGDFPRGITLGEDSDMWFRIGLCTEVGYVPARLAIYHIDDGSSGWTENLQWEPQWLQTYREWRLAGRIPKSKQQVAERFIRLFFLDRAVWRARAGHPLDALLDLCRGTKFGVTPISRATKAFIKVALVSVPWLRNAVP